MVRLYYIRNYSQFGNTETYTHNFRAVLPHAQTPLLGELEEMPVADTSIVLQSARQREDGPLADWSAFNKLKALPWEFIAQPDWEVPDGILMYYPPQRLLPGNRNVESWFTCQVEDAFLASLAVTRYREKHRIVAPPDHALLACWARLCLAALSVQSFLSELPSRLRTKKHRPPSAKDIAW